MLLLLSLLAALALVLAACGEDDDAVDEPDTDAEEEPDTEDETDTEDDTEDEADTEDDAEGEDEGAAGDGGEISIAWIPWEENIATANMWQAILEEEGYEVTLEQFDVAPAFAAVAGGDHDVFLDMWLPDTHASYEEEFGEDLEFYGEWFTEATLELSVPTYVVEEHGIESLADLEGNADVFDGQITGIEAGAGMMEILREEIMPGYNLEDEYELIESSTAAMRADLESATQAEEPIVVTLWTPHPEYGLKDLTRLEDPEGLWGEGEVLEVVGRPGFSDDFPEVAQWFENWEMTDEELASINAAIDEADDDEWESVAADWVEENRDLVDSWLE